MELQGKVVAALPERSGVSARGEWKAQDFVIETHESYPKHLVFTVFGADRLERFRIEVGQEVLVSFEIDAHEYQGRWYNSVRAFDVRQVDPAQFGVAPAAMAPSNVPFGAPAQPANPTMPQQPAQPAQTTAIEETSSDEDLPF